MDLQPSTFPGKLSLESLDPYAHNGRIKPLYTLREAVARLNEREILLRRGVCGQGFLKLLLQHLSRGFFGGLEPIRLDPKP